MTAPAPPPAPAPGNRPFEAVIFDLDGVLVDSEPLHHRTSQQLVAPRSISDAEYAQFVGSSVHVFLRWMRERDGLTESPGDLLRRWTALIVADLRAQPPTALRGAHDWIAAARQRDLAVGLCSQSIGPWVEATIGALGLAAAFDHVVTGEAASRAKPHPDLYLLAAERLDVAPAACLVFEDSVPGVRAAHAAGMTVVQTRGGSAAPPPQPEAHLVIESLDALGPELLDRGAPPA